MIAATYQGIIQLNKNATPAAIPFFKKQLALWADIRNSWLQVGDFEAAEKAAKIAKAYRFLINSVGV